MKGTSIIAYRKILETLPFRQRQVLQAIKSKPGITIREISKRINRPEHTFSGRCSELERKGLIIPKGEKKFKDSSQPHSKYYLNL